MDVLNGILTGAFGVSLTIAIVLGWIAVATKSDKIGTAAAVLALIAATAFAALVLIAVS